MFQPILHHVLHHQTVLLFTPFLFRVSGDGSSRRASRPAAPLPDFSNNSAKHWQKATLIYRESQTYG